MLIDGDAIAYMIGWNYRDFLSSNSEPADLASVAEAVRSSVDRWMEDFFMLVDCRNYLGVLSSESNRKNFRYGVYKYKPYKGNRQEDPEWITQWKPVINYHLISRWKFVRAPEELETDDVIATVAMEYYHATDWEVASTKVVICSPDKDLRQLPGQHYCYRTGKQHLVDEDKALWNWCMQMLCGDEVDCIAGVPGLGPKKSEKLLESACSFEWKHIVQAAYEKYFGAYYGGVIYQETAAAITLMSPAHPLWETYGFEVGKYKSLVVTSD
jgi:hypothetical protein